MKIGINLRVSNSWVFQIPVKYFVCGGGSATPLKRRAYNTHLRDYLTSHLAIDDNRVS